MPHCCLKNAWNLEAKIATRFRNDGIERKKDYGGLEAKVVTGFRNAACESTKVYEQLTK